MIMIICDRALITPHTRARSHEYFFPLIFRWEKKRQFFEKILLECWIFIIIAAVVVLLSVQSRSAGNCDVCCLHLHLNKSITKVLRGPKKEFCFSFSYNLSAHIIPCVIVQLIGARVCVCVSSRQWYLDLNEDGPLKLLSRCRALLSIEGHAHQHSTIKEKTNKWTKSRQSECGNILIAIVPQWKCSSIEAAPKTFIFHISSRICHCMSLYSEYMGLWCWMYGCDVVRMLIAEWDRIWNRRRRADAFKVNQMPLIKYIRHIHPAASHC